MQEEENRFDNTSAWNDTFEGSTRNRYYIPRPPRIKIYQSASSAILLSISSVSPFYQFLPFPTFPPLTSPAHLHPLNAGPTHLINTIPYLRSRQQCSQLHDHIHHLYSIPRNFNILHTSIIFHVHLFRLR